MEDDIIKYVIGFATKINDLENRIYEESKKDGADLQYLFKEFGTEKQRLISDYCTERKRVYSIAGSFGSPTQYVGIDSNSAVMLCVKTKSRVEVTITTNCWTESKYLFVVLKKAGEWQIDSYKSKMFGSDKWANQIL